MTQATVAKGVAEALDEAPLSRFHLRAVLTAGTGFFTDAYDLFIIGTALALIKIEYHPSPILIGLIGSTALLAAFVGSTVFGRIADIFGRKKIYGLEATLMAVAAIGSALSPNLIGGDYPVSAVLMSEYANRKNRGRLVGMVFSMQALGLLAGPLVALLILGLGVHGDVAWRVMLGLGAIPALGVIYLRRTLPESPRYVAQIQGRAAEAAAQMQKFTAGVVSAGTEMVTTHAKLTLRQFLSSRRYLTLLLGTAGCWFVFDYAFYGNTISTPLILKAVAPGASLITDTAIALLIFTVAAAPGYVLAFATVDRIGHRRLQLFGFAMMGLAFLSIALIPRVTRLIVPFVLIYGISYFFTEFGPNTTTFLLASELFPVSARTTGHGFSAGFAKVGAFIGTLTFPIVNGDLGLSAVMAIAGGAALIGLLLTRILPEPSGLSLEEIGGEARDVAIAAPAQLDVASV